MLVAERHGRKSKIEKSSIVKFRKILSTANTPNGLFMVVPKLGEIAEIIYVSFLRIRAGSCRVELGRA